jgi:hypothetical protein
MVICFVTGGHVSNKQVLCILFFSDKEPAEETLHLEDEQLGVDPPEVENVEYGTDSVHIGQATDAGSMAREEACYAYKTQLVELAKLMPPVYCTYRDCDKPVLVETSKVGTAMLIKWVSNSVVLYRIQDVLGSN